MYLYIHSYHKNVTQACVKPFKYLIILQKYYDSSYSNKLHIASVLWDGITQYMVTEMCWL